MRGKNLNQQLRDKILRERGLISVDKRSKLIPAAPVSEIRTTTARLVESHFDAMPLREIFRYYTPKQISDRTGVSVVTVWRWKKKLGIKVGK